MSAEYAHYLCDGCDKPIGEDGVVKLRKLDNGKRLVWGAKCADCAGQRKKVAG